MYTSAGLAFCYFLYVLASYGPVWQYDQFTVLIYLDMLTSLLPFFLSVLYHVFMCHCGGPAVYYRLLKVDVFGVWTTSTFASVSVMYSGLYCSPVLRNTYLAFYLLLSMGVLVSLMQSSTKQGRVLALTVQYPFRLLGFLLRFSPLGSGHPSSMSFYLLAEAIAGPAALANALYIPERWFPEQLSYVLNGHGLMHIAAIFCVHFGRKGFLLDMAWLNSDITCF